MHAAGHAIALDTGSFVLRERLATSAYGVLWRADSAHGPAAVKLVNGAQMARAGAQAADCFRQAARRETAFLRALAPWDARHIVRLLGSGEVNGLPALALELLDGDLAQQDLAHLAPRRALAWIGQLNQALARVHGHGWRYLDLKPANVLLARRSDTVKLADFGTSAALDDNAAHTYAGTASWQAPEQFFPDPAQRYRSDARSDYFSLGALLFYLMTGGQALRYGAACGAAWRAHGRAGAAMLRADHNGAVPTVLHADEAALFARRGGAPALALLRTLLAVDPGQRPRHAVQIGRALADASAATATSAVPPLRRAA